MATNKNFAPTDPAHKGGVVSPGTRPPAKPHRIRPALRLVFRQATTLILLALLTLSAIPARADSSVDALRAISDATAALVNDNAQSFLDSFDRAMPNYATLRANIEGLLNASTVNSTIDVVQNEGDDAKRTLTLDWVLILSAKNSNAGGKETRRQVVKCTVERKGRNWKVTSLDPIEFFKP